MCLIECFNLILLGGTPDPVEGVYDAPSDPLVALFIGVVLI